MSAFVDEMIWLRKDGAPWHNGGIPLETSPKSGREAMEMIRADFTVGLMESALLVPVDSGIVVPETRIIGEVPERVWSDPETEEKIVRAKRWVVQDLHYKYIVRLDTGEILGKGTKDYECLQPVDAFGFCDAALGEGLVEYRCAGTLKGSRVIWILASLPGFMKLPGDDIVTKYLLLATSFDGSMSVWILITPIRVVCWNTLQAAITGAVNEAHSRHSVGKAIVRFWHTRGIRERVFNYAAELAKIRDHYTQTEQVYNLLARRQLTEEEVKTYIEAVFPIREDAIRPGKMMAIRDRVRNLFEGEGLGSKLESAKGTAWGLYNAVSEWTDHTRGQDRSRLFSQWMGDSLDLKATALQYALDLFALDNPSPVLLGDGFESESMEQGAAPVATLPEDDDDQT
jgi:phage/plasmid-like protein (TIGR03299 family)